MISSDVATDFDFRALTQLTPELATLGSGYRTPSTIPAGDFALKPKQAVLRGSELTYSGIGVIAPALILAIIDERPALPCARSCFRRPSKAF